MRALGWSAADIGFRQGFQFIVSIALARILEPEAFGVMALVMTVTSFAAVFVDAGFGAALTREQEATHADESTVFWFNLGSAILLTGILCASAPVIALWFHNPSVAPVVIACSSIIVVSAMSSVQVVLLSKALNFKTQALVSAATVVSSGAAAIIFALSGEGVWALVAQAFTAALTSTVLYWACSRWRPSLTFSIASLRRLFGFGSFMMLTIAVDTLSARASSLVIGVSASARTLGYYARAETTSYVPGSLLQRIMPRVLFPAYAKIAHDGEALRAEILRAQALVALAAGPIMVGLAATAAPFVISIYGERWAPCVTSLQILALAGLGLPYQIVNLNALMAVGRSRDFFVLQLVKKASLVALIVAAGRFGMLAVAWSVLAGAIIAVAIDIGLCGRLLGLGVASQLRAAAGAYAASALMGAGVLAFVNGSAANSLPNLGVSILIGVSLYCLCLWLLRVEAARLLVAALRIRFAPAVAAGAP